MSKVVTYRPPETDSEDEYDGFYFGDDIVQKTRTRWTVEESQDDHLYNTLKEGDLEACKRVVNNIKNFNVDEYINGGFTPLLHACKYGNIDVVEYLLVELRASPNKNYDSYTPLMFAFDNNEYPTKDARTVEKLVQLLLKHGADRNVADKYGVTPFMLACKYGYTSIVRSWIKNVNLDIVDNMGSTGIFYAIESNHAEILKLLVEAGADTTTPNSKGYTPKQVAQFHGFYDLLDHLPKHEETFIVPSTYLSYGTLRDLIPRLFLKSDCPEYFQEVYAILMTLGLDKLVEYFAKERISLSEFLCMSDQRLKEIGIAFPIYRMKIQKALLDFHLHHWKAMSVARMTKSTKENFYEVLLLTANHLQNLIILKSSLRYIRQNITCKKLGVLHAEQLNKIEYVLQTYQLALKELRATAKYLSSFSPPRNPLYIDCDEDRKEYKRSKLKLFFKYTTFIGVGVSIFLCLKINIFSV